VPGYAREHSAAFDSSALEPDRRSPAGAVTSQTRSASMRSKANLYLRVVAIGAALLLTVSPAQLAAQQTAPAGVTVGESDLSGVVSGPNGPEAGVWVIAETTDLPTKFAKMVVTDDQGRYVLPELPKANYTVWVRGYGLVDSPKL